MSTGMDSRGESYGNTGLVVPAEMPNVSRIRLVLVFFGTVGMLSCARRKCSKKDHLVWSAHDPIGRQPSPRSCLVAWRLQWNL